MVDGRLTIVDLDGTLARVNTLHLYLRCGLLYLWNHRLYGRFAGVLRLVTARKMKFISHERMKYGAIRLIGHDDELMIDFALKATARFNDRVLSFIEMRREAGDAILLATAAADSYVPYLWKGDYVASPDSGPDLKGTRKRNAVAHFMHERGLTPSYFLTDHSDDLPLAAYIRKTGGHVLLVNPSARTLTTYNIAGISDVL